MEDFTPIASQFALEVMDFKGAGNGTPAMASSHPNYRAYTGIQYERRVAVRGGYFPYSFALSGNPGAMTINSRTGVITWPSPDTTTGTITLTVTDSNNDQVQTTFSVSVGTSGFYFLDGDFTGTTDGTISGPYKTLNAAVTGMQGNPTAILYIYQSASPYTFTSYSFDGTYDGLDGPADDAGSGTDGGCLYVNLGATTAGENWIAIPGESPVIDCQSEKFIRTFSPYWQGLTIRNGREYILKISSAADYWKFYGCEFDTVTQMVNSNRNQGCVFTVNDGMGYYGTFQNCDFHDFTGAQAMGSLYSSDKVLIESCHCYDGGYAGGFHSFATHVGLKEDCDAATVRDNFFEVDASSVTLSGSVELYGFPGGHSLDFSYNRVMVATDKQAITLTEQDWNGARFYRNNIKGRIDCDAGSHTNTSFTYNIIEGSFVDLGTATQSNNQTSAYGAALFDASGWAISTSNNATHGAWRPA